MLTDSPISTESEQILSTFILQECAFELETVMQIPPDTRNYSVELNLLNLLNRHSKLGLGIIFEPVLYSKILEKAVQHAQERILGQNIGSTDLHPKSRVHVRFLGVPLCSGLYHNRIPGVEVSQRLIAIRGTITRLGPVKMMDKCRNYECGKCKTLVKVSPDDYQFGQITKPAICMARTEDGPCKYTKFDLKESVDVGEKDDYQEIRIQELTSLLEVGAVPRSLTVILRHDLVDVCKAGDDATIVGWMISRWKPIKSGQRCENEFSMVANNVTVSNQRSSLRNYKCEAKDFANQFWTVHGDSPLRGRDMLVKSFSPKIFGLHLVKLAVLLTIIGGASDEDDAGSGNSGARKYRKEGHLLLVGDPGTAKSQFLISASKLCSRSVVTTGSGSTNAGLTVAASKESGEWQLEPGALVLADRGLCCIDEFNGLRAQDRTAIHEAMEQQTLSVAKAGLVCKLQTRCSLIAACNAKGRFEDGEPISSNLALASPLLSRFDLILVMVDRKNEEWDRTLSTSILEAACRTGSRRPKGDAFIDFDTLKGYVEYVRYEKKPGISVGGRIVLGKYYQLQRRADIRDAARTTIRLLESLIRLSQAHAKLMHQDTVQVPDTIWAIMLMETSLSNQSLLGMRPDLYLPAPVNAELCYSEYEAVVLKRLEINLKVIEDSHLELDEEADRILCSWPTTQHK